MSESFKIGDRVTWTSGAGGRSKEKTGTVVLIVPPDLVPCEMPLREIRAAHRDFHCSTVMPRGHESYLVSVPGRGKPTLYWPRAKGLRRVD